MSREGSRKLVAAWLCLWPVCGGLAIAQPTAAPEADERIEIPTPAGLHEGDPLIAARLEEAITRLESAPESAEAWRSLARLYFAHHHLEEAVSCFVRAAELAEPTARQLYLRALAEAQLGKVETALARVARAREIDQTYPPLWWRAGLWLLEQGKLDEAEGLFREAIERNAACEAAWIGLARVHLQRRQADEVERIVREHLLGRRNGRYARQLLASALRLEGSAARAAEEMARSRGTGPEFDDPWLRRVRLLKTGYQAESDRIDALLAVGRHAEAERLARRVLRQWPEDPMLLNNLAVARFGQGDRDGAARIWRRILEIDSQNALAHQNLAVYEANRAMRGGGSLDAAIEHIERSIEQNPNAVRSWEVRGGLLLAAGRLDEAERAFRRTLELDAENLSAVGQLGIIETRRGNWEAAARWFERATRIAPEDPRGHLQRARALVETGAFEEAERSLARAEAIVGPGDPRAAGLRAHLEERRAEAGGGG